MEVKEVMKKYFLKHKVEFAIAVLLAMASSVVFVGISLVLQYVIDKAIGGQIASAFIASLLFVIVFGLVFYFSAAGQVHLNTKVMEELRGIVAEKILSKNNTEFKEHDETDYISLVQNDVKRVEDSYLETLLSCIKALTQLLFAIVVMTRYSPIFTLTMFAMTLAMVVIPAAFSKKLENATGRVSKAQEDMTLGMSEVVYGFEVTKSFQKEKYRLQKFGICNGNLRRDSSKLEMLKALNNGLSNALAFTMQMVICILAGFFIYRGRLSYGSMVGVIQVSGSITTPVFQLFAFIPALKAFKPIREKIESYIKTDNPADVKISDRDWSSISLCNVGFSYDAEGGKDILSDVNITIEKGKKYLIVGGSGAGKTTLVNILAGKLKPDKGNILIDGQKSADFSNMLQHLSAGVWQNVFLFNESIKDNILMGDDKDNLSSVSDVAALNEVTGEKGLDFVVGANGDLLSGGQKQRIAIARALCADKDILIMDEGLSALNEEMGNRIEKMLLSDNRLTVISISHHTGEDIRAMYDEVIEIKNGKVA